MSRNPLSLLVLSLFVLLPTAVLAQGGTRQIGNPWQSNPVAQAVYWLGNEQMLKELDILPDQKEKLDKIRSEMQKKTTDAYSSIDFKDVKPEDRTAKYYEVINKVNDEVAKDVEKVLLPHQIKRLKQIMMQTRLASAGYGYGGAAALGQEDIAQELGITDQQREELKKAEEEVRAEVQKKTQEFYKKLQEEAREKLYKVLTPAQRKKLEDLQGEKFEWKWQQPAQTVPVAPAGSGTGTGGGAAPATIKVLERSLDSVREKLQVGK